MDLVNGIFNDDKGDKTYVVLEGFDLSFLEVHPLEEHLFIFGDKDEINRLATGLGAVRARFEYATEECYNKALHDALHIRYCDMEEV